MIELLPILLVVIVPAAVIALAYRGIGSLAVASLVGVVFSSGLEWPVSLRIVFTLILVWVLLTCLPQARRQGVALITLLCLAVCIALFVIEVTVPASSPTSKELWVRYALIFPTALFVGALLPASHRRFLRQSLLIFAVLHAVLAVYEFVSQHQLFQTVLTAATLDGDLRAGSSTEHPLVLSCLLAVAFTLVHGASTSRRWQVLLYCILLAGMLATASTAVPVLALAFLAVVVSGKLVKSASSFVLPVLLTIVVSILLLTGLFIRYDSPIILSITDSASDLYRLVLYSFAAPALQLAPWGWGLTGLPAGFFFVPTAFGAIDLARTIDSEYVLLILQAGWVGVVLCFALIWLAWLRRVDPGTRWTIFMLLACGLFLALHAWIGLGAITLILLGTSLTRGLSTARHDEPAAREVALRRQLSKDALGPYAQF